MKIRTKRLKMHRKVRFGFQSARFPAAAVSFSVFSRFDKTAENEQNQDGCQTEKKA